MTTDELRSPDFKAPRSIRQLADELARQRQRIEALCRKIELRP
jgi:hypothetical protein